MKKAQMTKLLKLIKTDHTYNWQPSKEMRILSNLSTEFIAGFLKTETIESLNDVQKKYYEKNKSKISTIRWQFITRNYTLKQMQNYADFIVELKQLGRI